MKILGIDPGLERVGYGVIQKDGSKMTLLQCGLIQTPRIDLALRLRQIHEEVKKIVELHQPDVLSIEKLIFAANKTTAFDVSKAIGVILLAASEMQIPWQEFTPPEIKLAICGHGQADKKQIQYMVCKILGLAKAPQPDDVSDAVAVAICAGFRAKLSSLTTS